MKRLIILGNGFDLAHGLKTRYTDFLKDYFAKILNLFYANKTYHDELIQMDWNNQFSYRLPKNTIDSENSISEFIKLYNQQSYVSISLQSKFLIYIAHNGLDNDMNWFDFERLYYTFLLNCVHNGEYNIQAIKALNREFACIKEYLIKYLKQIENYSTQLNIDSFSQLPYNILNGNEFSLESMDNSYPTDIYFLNFNYTNIAERYLTIYRNINPQINYIHGKLSDNIDQVCRLPRISAIEVRVSKFLIC